MCGCMVARLTHPPILRAGSRPTDAQPHPSSPRNHTCRVNTGPYLIDYVDDLLDMQRGCYMVLSPVCRETMEQVRFLFVSLGVILLFFRGGRDLSVVRRCVPCLDAHLAANISSSSTVRPNNRTQTTHYQQQQSTAPRRHPAPAGARLRLPDLRQGK